MASSKKEMRIPKSLSNMLRRKQCPLSNEELILDYKNVALLEKYVTDGGKIVPRRISGVSARKQRELAHAVKRARNIALLSFTSGQTPQEAEV